MSPFSGGTFNRQSQYSRTARFSKSGRRSTRRWCPNVRYAKYRSCFDMATPHGIGYQSTHTGKILLHGGLLTRGFCNYTPPILWLIVFTFISMNRSRKSLKMYRKNTVNKEYFIYVRSCKHGFWNRFWSQWVKSYLPNSSTYIAVLLQWVSSSLMYIHENMEERKIKRNHQEKRRVR